MTDNTAISLKNVSKVFKRYHRPADRLKEILLPGKQRADEFWALQNIDLEIEKGSAIGVIGRNGSGKSTLLQIIAGTLQPTTGDVSVSGRVSALLELGSGFNPEFTGRQNVFFNGQILGLTQSEIEARFDKIAAFADIGSFIDQPVRTYSSGMYVRLAFAVVANVDAEVLIIDEALSVGDAVFTQKCMRFIRQFREVGTLIFVSHDMASVHSLCPQAVWLSDGCISLKGKSQTVAEKYLRYSFQQAAGEGIALTPLEGKSSTESTEDAELEELEPEESDSAELASEELALELPVLDYSARFSVTSNLENARGWQTTDAEVLSVQLTTPLGEKLSVCEGGEQVCLEITAIAYKDINDPILGFIVRDRLGQDLFGENTLPFTGLNPIDVAAGSLFSGKFTFRLPMLPNGQYAVMASVADGTLQKNVQHHWLNDALIINVYSSQVRWGLVGVSFFQVSLQC